MAQPNLSKAIRELEDNLCIEIFHRTPKGMVPTAQGETFLRYANIILEQVERMEALGRNEGASQRFYAVLSHASYVTDAALRLIAEQAISGEIRLREMEGKGALREVQGGRTDVAVVRYALPQEAYFTDLMNRGGLCGELLWEYDARLTLHASHPLARAEKVEASDLQAWPELFFWNDELLHRPILQDRRIFLEDRAAVPGLLQATQGYIWATPARRDDLAARGLAQPPCALTVDSSLR